MPIIATPLSDLTKKGRPESVNWSKEEDIAFRRLKEELCNSPILRLPDWDKQFVLRTDASNFGLGAVLLQRHADELFPVAYASKKLSPAQAPYSTIERECLAVVWALEKLYLYLYGRRFVLQTDHRPLTYLKSAKLNNSRLMRWALRMQPFDFTIVAIKGIDNVGADFLSRVEESKNSDK